MAGSPPQELEEPDGVQEHSTPVNPSNQKEEAKDTGSPCLPRRNIDNLLEDSSRGKEIPASSDADGERGGTDPLGTSDRGEKDVPSREGYRREYSSGKDHMKTHKGEKVIKNPDGSAPNPAPSGGFMLPEDQKEVEVDSRDNGVSQETW